MAELIDRQALLKAINDDGRGKEIAQMRSGKVLQTLTLVLEHIHTAPTIAPEELRPRGEWTEHEWAEEENGLLVSNFECSVCHEWERKTSDYCPNCGAKMEG